MVVKFALDAIQPGCYIVETAVKFSAPLGMGEPEPEATIVTMIGSATVRNG